jgi:hypothetical protein
MNGRLLVFLLTEGRIPIHTLLSTSEHSCNYSLVLLKAVLALILNDVWDVCSKAMILQCELACNLAVEEFDQDEGRNISKYTL